MATARQQLGGGGNNYLTLICDSWLASNVSRSTTSGNWSLLKTMSRQVFPHAPSPTITNFFLMAAIWGTETNFLLLREKVQALPQRDRPNRAPLGDGQRQITEHIECVGVVGAHGAVQRAPQLA
ncbi:hypothetical protein EYF80_007475 [Liparis tanakae]|uniref:Uncharacterized protein n=1 Tax=Liparis tanakae TaxID=230148 RepID=A0A4Z2IXT9_9TELE|nr:hypothetical protein EYF80_007475 [Liparis tanakae]